jgi:two-component system LytT family response regulator
MKLRIVAVDDEPLALRGLELLLQDIEDAELVGTASGYATALQAIERLKPDLVLLDIKMRDGSGLTLAQDIARTRGPGVIFVTAFDRFAVRAFELAAIDYILKPADVGRLRAALQRSRQQLRVTDGEQRIAELQAIIRSMREDEQENGLRRPDPELWVRRNVTDLVRIPASAIDMIESEGSYVRIHVGERSYLHRASIRALEEQLQPDAFVRIHRARLVRVGAIQEVRRSKLGAPQILLSGGRVLHAGRVYAKALRQRLTTAA